MGQCLLVSGSLEVCDNNFLHFCVYSCYRNCYAKLSCGEGQVRKNCTVWFSLRARRISYALVIACHIFISFFLFKRNFAKKRWLWFLACYITWRWSMTCCMEKLIFLDASSHTSFSLWCLLLACSNYDMKVKHDLMH